VKNLVSFFQAFFKISIPTKYEACRRPKTSHNCLLTFHQGDTLFYLPWLVASTCNSHLTTAAHSCTLAGFGVCFPSKDGFKW